VDHSEETLGRTGALSAPPRASPRWMLIDMVEKAGRHAGDLDVIRELVDSEKDCYWTAAATICHYLRHDQ
jgi:hypothetical protein